MLTKKRYSGAILYRSTGTVLLQLRDQKRDISNPGKLTTFGGSARRQETPFATLKRELLEEVGLAIQPADCLFLGVYTKREKKVVTHCHFYAVLDRNHAISSTTEGQLVTIQTIDAAANDSRISHASLWALQRFKTLLAVPGAATRRDVPLGVPATGEDHVRSGPPAPSQGDEDC